MNEWATFYKDRLNESYYKHINKRYSPFIKEIKRNLSKDLTVVELGCGIGSISRSLKSSKCKLICVDNNSSMLKMSKRNKLSHAIFIKQDITKSYKIKADIAHSHGVLEHFSDEQIRKIIKIQKKQYKTLIHYVPSKKYKNPSFGDERLMTVNQWKRICNPDEIIEFNNGYDLILKFNKE